MEKTGLGLFFNCIGLPSEKNAAPAAFFIVLLRFPLRDCGELIPQKSTLMSEASGK